MRLAPSLVVAVTGLSGLLVLAACGSDASEEPGTSPTAPTSSGDGGPSSSVDGGPGSSSGEADASIPDPPYTGPRAKSVVASDSRSCAIYDNGELRCWGAGVGKPAVVMAGKSFSRVALGRKDGAACAIETTGALFCWTTAAPTPAEVAGGPWAEVAIGDDQLCAITKVGGLACWGANGNGQLGVGDQNPRTTPTAVGDGTDWTKIAAGERWTCGLRGAGALFCWGTSSGSGGQNLQSSTPAAIDAANTFKDLAMYASNRSVVRSDGTWLLGTALGFTAQNADLDWASARLGGSHRCARKASGAVWCAGNNQRGQIGSGATEFQSALVKVAGDATWEAVATGESHSCAIRSDDGSVRCWGAATRGQLGDARPISPRVAPSQVGVGTDWVALDANQSRTCGTRADGSVSCWGQGIAVGGDLLGSLDRQEPRAAFQAGAGWSGVDLGMYHYCVRKVDGTLACWGAANDGQTGTGAAPNGFVAAPTTVSGLLVQDVSPGMLHTCGIDLAGKLWCWGSATYNRLGFASATSVMVPTKVGDDTWKSVAASYTNTCAVRTDGALFCFGFSFTGLERIGADLGWTAVATTPNDNEYFGVRGGVLHRWSGNGGSKVPFAVSSTSGWATLAGNYLQQCGVKTDGTLWCVVGQGSNVTTQVGTTNDWKSVAVGYAHACAIKTSGTAWCWGANDSGQIGDGTAWSPTPRLAQP